MRITNRANLPDAEFDAFKREFESHTSLQDLLRWAQRQPEGALVPGVIAELIIQDEFTHDLIVPWRELFLVYSTT